MFSGTSMSFVACKSGVLAPLISRQNYHHWLGNNLHINRLSKKVFWYDIIGFTQDVVKYFPKYVITPNLASSWKCKFTAEYLFLFKQSPTCSGLLGGKKAFAGSWFFL